MAQAGVYAPASVIEADVTVRVAGVPREHVSMSWSGDTTGGLPDQVVSAGTGMRSRTGSIVWAPDRSVLADPPHPLRRVAGWPPREGDEVVIDATVDTGQGPYQFRRFTGRLGRTTGSLTDGTLTSEITDMLGDSLRAMCTVPPMILGDYTKSHQIAYRAAEQAGLGVLPPVDASVVAHVGMQGGNEPTVGTRVTASAATGFGDPYGVLKVSNLRIATTSEDRGTRQVLVIGRASSNDNSEIRVQLTTGTAVSLHHTHATGGLGLFVSGVGWVWQGQSTDTSPLPLLAFQTLSSGVRVFTSLTEWVDVTGWTIPAGAGVRHVEGTLLVGESVRYIWSGGTAVVARTPKLPFAWLASALEVDFMAASRTLENVTARSVMDAWSEATLASYWMDEHGKPWAVARDRLVTRPVSRTVQVDERVFSGSWSVGDDQVRSGVMIKGEQGARDRPHATDQMALIYQEQSARSFDEGSTIERFIEAPAEEEWGPVDLSPSRYGSNAQDGRLAGIGTWIGAVTSARASSDDPEQWAQIDGVGYTCAVERLGHRTLKVTEVISNVPSSRTAYLKAASLGTSLHPAYRGLPSPTIRGSWKTSWADFTVKGATTGPSWAPPLEHDASWFLTPGNAQRFADALAAEVTKAMPTLDGVSVLWDPTRQIGDVETWIATDSAGRESWRANVLVSGYSEDWDGNVPDQQVDVRVISWTDPTDGKTYGDLSAAYSTYAGMTGTYQQTLDALPGTV